MGCASRHHALKLTPMWNPAVRALLAIGLATTTGCGKSTAILEGSESQGIVSGTSEPLGPKPALLKGERVAGELPLASLDPSKLQLAFLGPIVLTRVSRLGAWHWFEGGIQFQSTHPEGVNGVRYLRRRTASACALVILALSAYDRIQVTLPAGTLLRFSQLRASPRPDSSLYGMRVSAIVARDPSREEGGTEVAKIVCETARGASEYPTVKDLETALGAVELRQLP
jgi:hypothetical protein